jgi:hypothetical protein
VPTPLSEQITSHNLTSEKLSSVKPLKWSLQIMSNSNKLGAEHWFWNSVRDNSNSISTSVRVILGLTCRRKSSIWPTKTRVNETRKCPPTSGQEPHNELKWLVFGFETLWAWCT